jgi:hypothetical protein
MISGSEYKDRWNKYALQFHPDVNVPPDVSQLFNEYLFDWIHQTLRNSLRKKQALALKETSPKHWDQVVEILCQVDADTLSHSMASSLYHEVTACWFEVWKVSSQILILHYPFDIYIPDTAQRPLGRGNCVWDPIGTPPIRSPMVARGWSMAWYNYFKPTHKRGPCPRYFLQTKQ